MPPARRRLAAALRLGQAEGVKDGQAWRNPHDDFGLGTAWAYGFFLGRGELPPRDVVAAAGRLGLADLVADLEAKPPTYDHRNLAHMRALRDGGFSRLATARLTGASTFGVGRRVGPFPRHPGRASRRCAGLRGRMAFVRATGEPGRITDVHLGPGSAAIAVLELADGRTVLEYAKGLIVGGRWVVRP